MDSAFVPERVAALLQFCNTVVVHENRSLDEIGLQESYQALGQRFFQGLAGDGLFLCKLKHHH